jgi:SAM-dependent methyltransferase
MQAIYDTIGAAYSSTRCADPAIVQSLARYTGAKNGFCFLDVGCGTGHYTKAIAAFGGHWYGTDILDSGQFKEIAETYATTAGDYAYVVANKRTADSP